jgi:hypothetical protein
VAPRSQRTYDGMEHLVRDDSFDDHDFSEGGEQVTPQVREREITRTSGDVAPVEEVSAELGQLDLGSGSQANRLTLQSSGATPIDSDRGGQMPWEQHSPTSHLSGVSPQIVGESPATNTAGFSSEKSSVRPSQRVPPLDRISVTTARSSARNRSEFFPKKRPASSSLAQGRSEIGPKKPAASSSLDEPD